MIVPDHLRPTMEEEQLDTPSSEAEDEEESVNINEDIEMLEDTENSDAPVPKRKEVVLKKERKVLRNTGKLYVRSSGEIVSGRERKPPHECKVRSCHTNITEEVGNQIFKEYWAQGTYNKRLSYVVSRIECYEVQRKRSREDVDNRAKNQSFKYFFEWNGRRIQVCRSTFLDTLGETDRFIRHAAENKKIHQTGISTDDTRGKHVPKHALPEEKRQTILDHIIRFPAYESHYCRAQTQQLYLSPELSIKKMHDLYLEEGLPKVSYDTYRKIFKTTKRKFHAPKTDGCNKCDKMDVQINAAEGEAKEKLKKGKELHLRKAEMRYALKRRAKAAAAKEEEMRVLVFDLQQCLPTPHLKCKDIYYARQLYVYNFTVTDTVTDLTHCYMWSEVEGHRGANEVASCLLEHILQQVPPGVTRIKMFSDCCSGQNRNSIVAMAMFVALQEHPSLEIIEHIFLVPGHTFLPEVDSRHSVIEKYKKKVNKINVPSEWYNAVWKAGMTNKTTHPDGKFQVVHKVEFLNISALAAGIFVKRNQTVNKAPFQYLSTQWMKYEKKAIGIMEVKGALSPEAPFETVSFLRRGMRSDRLPRVLDQVPRIPARAVPISFEKKQDLLALLGFLDAEHHHFYQQLPSLPPKPKNVRVPEYHPDYPAPVDE